MGGSSKTVTVGYKYYVGMHMVLCHGPIDSLIEIEVDGRIAWQGRRQSGPLSINKPSLFGGDSREGGISGTVDVLSGASNQGFNAYLQSKIGGLVPAFRGVFSLVLRQVYVGLNPYLKKWAFRVKRIHTRQNGIKQWYDARAEINGDVFAANSNEYSNIYSGATLNSVDFNGSTWLTAGENASLRRSTNGGESWQNTAGASGSFFKEIASNADGIFIATTGDFSAVQRSANNGESFSVVSIPSIEPGNVRPNCVCWGNVANTFMVGCDYGGFGYVAVSQNGGTSWTNVPYPGANYGIGSSPTSLVWAGGNRFLASTVSGFVYKSDNIGFTWEITAKQFVKRLFKTPFNILAITETDSISRSFDMGVTWQNSQPLPFVPQSISHFNDLLICVGIGGKIALSFDYGATWEQLAQTLAGGSNLLDIKSNGSDLAYAVGTGGVAARIKIIYSRKGDMNPAHIIRECLTDPDWGMGYAENDIDDVSFSAAADVLYREGMGISLLWDRQTAIEEFVKEVVKHIDAALFVDRFTGKFILKLIRFDYEEASLVHLTESNIDKLSDFSRPTFGELTNSISVNYWDTDTNTDASVTLQDIALTQMQGSTINTTIQYPGFTNKTIATKVAERDLKTLSTPLITCTIYANTEAANLNIGSAFKLTWPDYDVYGVVMRVTGIAYGDGKNNRVRINATQDVFNLPDSVIIEPPSPEWEDPNVPPVVIENRIVFEVPYLELVQANGQTAVDGELDSNPEVGYVGAAAIRPQSNAINARLMVNDGNGFEDVGGLDFCPGAYLDGLLNFTDDVFSIKDLIETENVSLGSWCQIGSEIMQVIDLNSSTMQVRRGCLDTIPPMNGHADGSPIYFCDAYIQASGVEYVQSDELSVRLLTSTGGGELLLEDAPEDSLEIVGRAARPYRPGNFKANDAYSFESFESIVWPVELTWVSRNRKQETAQNLIGYFDPAITSEEGVTYTVRIVELDGSGNEGTVLHTESGIAVQNWTFPKSIIESSGAPQFKVGIKSYRDGISSYSEPYIIIPGSLIAPTNLTAVAENY